MSMKVLQKFQDLLNNQFKLVNLTNLFIKIFSNVFTN
jgi:hypothetical protein